MDEYKALLEKLPRMKMGCTAHERLLLIEAVNLAMHMMEDFNLSIEGEKDGHLQIRRNGLGD